MNRSHGAQPQYTTFEVRTDISCTGSIIPMVLNLSLDLVQEQWYLLKRVRVKSDWVDVQLAMYAKGRMDQFLPSAWGFPEEICNLSSRRILHDLENET